LTLFKANRQVSHKYGAESNTVTYVTIFGKLAPLLTK